mmetsp:Transcript_49190/g.72130  ORF Transcript_49190/g.72130 Transcript_49190/m.72130 type:complete len:112 (-) Transcript_49190:1090-1425(-)
MLTTAWLSEVVVKLSVFFCGDDSVALNELCQNASLGLDTKSERSHVEEEEICSLRTALTREDTTLHSSAEGHSLIRVDTLVELLAIKELLEQLLDLGDTRGATHQHHLVDL